jgi:hypothetical protein
VIASFWISGGYTGIGPEKRPYRNVGICGDNSTGDISRLAFGGDQELSRDNKVSDEVKDP